jgi:septal ring factor EnvC (AmiA/AmiB activator)
MSFSVELWDGYDLVYNTFLLHRRGLKDFIYMMSEKHDHEFDFARNMKKIYDMNFAVTKMPTLQNGIIAFKNDLLNQYNYTIEFVNSLREEVIDPLKQFMNEQNNLGKILNTEMKKVEKEFKDVADKLDRARNKFHNLAKNAEDSKLQSELAKLNTNLNFEQKNKFEIKSQNSLKEAKDAERLYIANVNTANNIRDVYIETMKKSLNEFQNMEEKLVEMTKDSLRKYVIYQVALIRNLQYDIERKASFMEGINAQADIRSFIERNATNSLPPYKFEFIPYASEIDSRVNVESNKYPKEVLSNVKNFISNVFHAEPPESEVNFIF